MKQLLALKAEFKKLTGQDYKPGMAPPTSASPAPSPATSSSSSPSALYERVVQQGEVVRKLKSEKAPKVFCYILDNRDVMIENKTLFTHTNTIYKTN